MIVNRHAVTPQQAALLLLKILDERAKERLRERGRLTRARVPASTLERIWNRPRLHQSFLVEVQDWLLRAGWVLLDAGVTFAVVRIDAVENWPAISSKPIRPLLDDVMQGTYLFEKLETLVPKIE